MTQMNTDTHLGVSQGKRGSLEKYRQLEKPSKCPSAPAYPGASKNAPLIDSEVLPDPLDIPGIGVLTWHALSESKIVLDQVPSGVFLDTRAPGRGNAVSFLVLKHGCER